MSNFGIMSSLNFWIKLIISLFIDFVGLGFAIGMFTGLGIPLAVGYGVVQGIVAIAFWDNFALALMVGAVESVPAINALPTLTIFCLWRGFKSGWRF